MHDHTQSISSSGSTDGVVLSWAVHLARLSPGRAAFVIGVTVLTCITAYFVTGAVGVVAACAAMIAFMSDFLFPVKYEITRRGAACRTILKTSEIRWQDVKRCYHDDLGVKLSPLDRRSRLEAFRGVYLRFGGAGTSDDVIRIVQEMRQDQCRQ